MASDLTVAVLTGGTVFHVHGFDDGVAAEFTFHIQQRTLDIMLSIFFAGGIGKKQDVDVSTKVKGDISPEFSCHS